MTYTMRPLADHDVPAVVELSLMAWAPPFSSVNDVLGDELASRLHGEDWRVYQGRAVRETLADPSSTAWVAEADEGPVGFVVATVADPDRLVGEITMLAVDPAYQGQGIGRALVDHGTAWLANAGMRVAMIGTGGDSGHAPARQVYEQAGYHALPLVRYFKAL